MLDVNNNFKGKYRDTKCRKCNHDDETQERILNDCTGIHNDEESKTRTEDIFNEDTTQLRKIAKKIENTMKKLEDKQP